MNPAVPAIAMGSPQAAEVATALRNDILHHARNGTVSVPPADAEDRRHAADDGSDKAHAEVARECAMCRRLAAEGQLRGDQQFKNAEHAAQCRPTQGIGHGGTEEGTDDDPRRQPPEYRSQHRAMPVVGVDR